MSRRAGYQLTLRRPNVIYPSAMFEQTLNPTGHLWLTILAALVPLIALILMLAVFRITAWFATIIAGAITIPVGVLVWHAPLASAMKSYLFGGMTGVWSIDWITFWGLIIFNTLVLTGDFERFESWMVHHATADIRIQTIMLAWAFGALLEGLVGFGYPWAVVVPILVGLGIADLDAIRVAALANNAPVSYGALGAPIIGLAAVTGLPLMALSGSIGNVVAVLALLPPWVLIYLVSGRRGVAEAWPLAVVGSLSYIAGQWPVARFLGPYLPDLSGALASFWILFLFVKIWRPKTVRGFGGAVLESPARNVTAPTSVREALRVWLPYIVLIVVVVAWTGPWSTLPTIILFKLSIAAKSSVTLKPIASVFNFAPFNGGSSIFASWLVILALLQPSGRILRQVFSRTFKQMWGALLVAFFIFALAYVFVYTGMANSLAYGLSKIGIFFVVLAPILGWIGVALSGSNTSTNAMFGPVQMVTGRLLNLPVLLLPTLNSVGAEVGKPIAPQTASVGVSTSKLVRSEGQVIRHNMGWTLIVLAYLILIALVFFRFLPRAMSL
ncbi:MAG TPA: L-lactate permease [Candidatus Acidoferrum sp.]|nr:L-lactate permease [Candidatus Acidoferrum sp.]